MRTLFGTILLSLLASACARSDLQILRASDFHEDEVSAKTGDSWWALTLSKNTGALKKTRLKVTRFQDIDDADGTPTGKRISVAAQNSVLLLNGDAPFLKEKAIPLAKLQGSLPIYFQKNEPISLTLKGNRYRVTMRGSEAANEDVVLTAPDGTTQVLYRETEGSQLIWAGDLDEDGRLDLLLEGHPEHYNVTQLKLFLSSETKGKQLVRLAAELRTVGC